MRLSPFCPWQGDPRHVYYRERDAGWLLADVVIERGEQIRVTAYPARNSLTDFLIA